MGVCNIVSTPCHATHWIIKGEKLIWGERQGRSSGLSELEIEIPVTFFEVNVLVYISVGILTLWLASAWPSFCVEK